MSSYQLETLINNQEAAIAAIQLEQFSLQDGGDPPDYAKVVATISPELFDNESFIQELLHVMRYQIEVSFIGFTSPRLRNDAEFLVRMLDLLYGNPEDELFTEDKYVLACGFVNSAMPEQHREALSIYAGLLTGLYSGDIHAFLESEFIEVTDDPEDLAVQALNIALEMPTCHEMPMHKIFWSQYQALISPR